jgi:hypothetical protein
MASKYCLVEDPESHISHLVLRRTVDAILVVTREPRYHVLKPMPKSVDPFIIDHTREYPLGAFGGYNAK